MRMRILPVRGFNLIEVMVALGLLALAVLGLGAMTYRSLAINTQSRVYSEVALRAMDRMEALQARGRDDVLREYELDREGRFEAQTALPGGVEENLVLQWVSDPRTGDAGLRLELGYRWVERERERYARYRARIGPLHFRGDR